VATMERKRKITKVMAERGDSNPFNGIRVSEAGGQLGSQFLVLVISGRLIHTANGQDCRRPIIRCTRAEAYLHPETQASRSRCARDGGTPVTRFCNYANCNGGYSFMASPYAS
jgi:hypothetical protein